MAKAKKRFYCVKTPGKPLSCHKTKSKAKKQVASRHAAGKKARIVRRPKCRKSSK